MHRAVLLVLLLAGCSQPVVEEAPENDLGLHATEDTGFLHGVVVDVAIVPIAGAEVTAAKDGRDHIATTDDQGRFGIADLAPGTYVLDVASAHHISEQMVVSVVAGDDSPPLLKIVMDTDTERLPYAMASYFQGFMECGIRGGTGNTQVCRIINDFSPTPLSADNTRYQVPIGPAPRWVQTEMVWESSQPLGDRMGYAVQQYTLDGAGDYAGLDPHNQGTSPLVLWIDSDGVSHCPECDDDPINMTIWTEVQVRALAGGLKETEPPVDICSPTGRPCLEETGVVLSQSYDLFLHVFYNFVPPEGWTFGTDGEPTPT